MGRVILVVSTLANLDNGAIDAETPREDWILIGAYSLVIRCVDDPFSHARTQKTMCLVSRTLAVTFERTDIQTSGRDVRDI
jgi:hypothetical protein